MKSIPQVRRLKAQSSADINLAEQPPLSTSFPEMGKIYHLKTHLRFTFWVDENLCLLTMTITNFIIAHVFVIVPFFLCKYYKLTKILAE